MHLSRLCASMFYNRPNSLGQKLNPNASSYCSYTRFGRTNTSQIHYDGGNGLKPRFSRHSVFEKLNSLSSMADERPQQIQTCDLGVLKVGKRKAVAEADKSSKRKPKKEKPAKKDPNKPKRPPSAFFVFLEEFRKTFKKENPNVKAVSAEKAPYEAKAAKKKSEYEKLMNAYNKKQESMDDDGDEESERSKSEVNDEDDEGSEQEEEEEEEEDDEDD
ncbi:High mobility group B protein [Actinidia chinensis var. chinensis]|uniref:High mobility group B protein n=1 Tax=Actinidia chinensis var. chinensis TaxID=1590841 RepID=A0A2R6RXE3_ACTCC|nr:High mobility group B protein [Actinidia chinensis var. chinensis]